MQLVEVKASLKAQKVEVAGMVEELEERGRELSKRLYLHLSTGRRPGEHF